MKKAKKIPAKKIKGYCDFCGVGTNVCSHCIPLNNTGFVERRVEEGKSFVYDKMEFFLILFLLKGKVVLTAPNGQETNIRENSMMIFSKGDILRITAQEEAHIVIFEFLQMPDFCETIRLQHFQQYCDYAYDYLPTPMVDNVQTFVEECLFFMRHDMLCDKFAALKRSEFFYLISVLYPPSQLATFLHPLLGREMDFKAIVMQNYSLSLLVSDLIKRTNYSRNAFYLKFREEFGMPVKEWIVKQRIGQMRVIAMEPQMTPKEMMYRCGFSSSGNFAKFCKKQIGMTPTEFINDIRREEKGVQKHEKTNGIDIGKNG